MGYDEEGQDVINSGMGPTVPHQCLFCVGNGQGELVAALKKVDVDVDPVEQAEKSLS